MKGAGLYALTNTLRRRLTKNKWRYEDVNSESNCTAPKFRLREQCLAPCMQGVVLICPVLFHFFHVSQGRLHTGLAAAAEELNRSRVQCFFGTQSKQGIYLRYQTMQAQQQQQPRRQHGGRMAMLSLLLQRRRSSGAKQRSKAKQKRRQRRPWVPPQAQHGWGSSASIHAQTVFALNVTTPVSPT
eukprot:1155264-Pelagomonas_calceolata.AAC.5